ncbi:MAG: hypothetical protein JJU20_02445 [Opitutales bacterium]|nr:hypothetical protein [Opitutales bacterium]
MKCSLLRVLCGMVPIVGLADSIELGDRRELFVDDRLIESMEGLAFHLHEPRAEPMAAKSALPALYTTVILDDGLYRAYYRDYRTDYEGEFYDGNWGEVYAYAESDDGIHWRFPDLGLSSVESSKGRNVILTQDKDGRCHNFSPFLDRNPQADPAQRYKAIAGVHPTGGLYAYASPDGIHWERLQEDPILTMDDFAFDSHNVAFWCVVEKQYVCYFRSWDSQHGSLRTISRSYSEDFIHWSEPVSLDPNRPGEHLYTSNTQPYFRAPHIYIALPTRFMPDRGNSTDILFMAKRAGALSYTRLFEEAFIRPGRDPAHWGNRANYLALNVVPTGPDEISFYHRNGNRYTLRTDGFISLRAGANEGFWLSKPFNFDGNSLEINFSTSAAGRLQIEILDASDSPEDGEILFSSDWMTGDAIDQLVPWKVGSNLSDIAGKTIRIRVSMTEADLFAFRFR